MRMALFIYQLLNSACNPLAPKVTMVECFLYKEIHLQQGKGEPCSQLHPGKRKRELLQQRIDDKDAARRMFQDELRTLTE